MHWLWRYFNDTDALNPKVLERREWIKCKLHDNPAYSDDGRSLNSLGEQAYEDLLADNPPGIDRDRYVFGLWVAAEGAVFSEFDFRKHVVTTVPDLQGEHWTHYRGIDFGDDSPFVCLWSSLNRDNGVLMTHREWRMTHTDIEDHAEAIRYYTYEDEIKWSVADSAHASERRSLRRYGIKTSPSPKGIADNIRLMKKRIHHNKWFIFKDLLIKKDHRLIMREAALSILDEIGKLTYPQVKNGTPADDLPDKKCEKHGVDAASYKIAKLDRREKGQGRRKVQWSAQTLEI